MEKIIVVLVVLQRRYPRSAENAAVRRGNKRHQVDKMVEQFLTHDRWDARCVSKTGSEHSGDCRETAGTETVQTIENIEKTVKVLVAVLVSGGGLVWTSTILLQPSVTEALSMFHNMSHPFDHTCCLDKSEVET